MLAKADVVFLVDESVSSAVGVPPNQQSITHLWLEGAINRFDDTSFTESFTSKGITDIKYGLVGFGDNINNTNTARFAHSQIVDTAVSISDPTALFGNQAQLEAAIGPLDDDGTDGEDAWDAIEHTIAEYDIRDGSVPIFVLIQDEEGRVPLNDTLTHDGILAALQSKNAILNSLVVGQNQTNDPVGAAPDPLFDLSPYEATAGDFDDIYVLGVESDTYTDDNVADRQHDYHWIDTNTVNSTVDVPAKTVSDALQISHNGSNTGDSGMVGTGKSILISQNITDGIGGTLGTDLQYRAKSVPFDDSDDLRGDLASQSLGSSASGATILGDTENLSGFSFDFFDHTQANSNAHTQFLLDSDGTITMDGNDAGTNIENLGNTNVDLSQLVTGQTRPVDPAIAVLWDDLSFDFGKSDILWKVSGSGADQRLIVQWVDFQYHDDIGSKDDPISFQAMLYSDGRIGLNYFDLDSYPQNDDDTTVNETGGISATVGIWGGTSDTLTSDAGKFVPGLHSIGGATIRFSTPAVAGAVDTNDSYVHMAWDTGGAAWDLGIVKSFDDESVSGPAAVNTPELNALRDEFIDSLGNQILHAEANGRVFHEDHVVLALNLGSSSDLNAGEAGVFRADDGDFTVDGGQAVVDSYAPTPPNDIDIRSNSIPVVDSSNPKPASSVIKQVFHKGRGEESDDLISENLQLSINKLDDGAGSPIALPAGKYVVELYFASILHDNEPVFDVLIEGKQFLNDYSISNDHAKIVDFVSAPIIELDAQQASSSTGVVKRFEVDVTGNLDIELRSEFFRDPMLSAVRVLKSDPAPQVTDVIIENTTDGFSYSFAELLEVANNQDKGRQLSTVPVPGADSISIQFSHDMHDSTLENALTVQDLTWNGVDDFPVIAPQTGGFSYDAGKRVATWEFAAGAIPNLTQVLVSLDATVVKGASGRFLDGEWVNPTSVSTTNPAQSEFPSGDGEAGGDFHFVFTTLMPFNLENPDFENITSNNELTALLDNWGNVYTNTGDTPGNGDFDGNGSVGNSDLTLLLDTWGKDDLADLIITETEYDGIAGINNLDLDEAFNMLGFDLTDSLAS